MTATKMKSLCLTGPEVRTLQQTGKLVQFVVMEPQPPEDIVALYCDSSDKLERDNVWQYQIAETDETSGIIFNAQHVLGDGNAPFAPGERRWVREAFQPNPHGSYWYEADSLYDYQCPDGYESAWKPSSHMPRRASRLTIEVVAIKAMQIQDISEDDIRAEGVGGMRDLTWASPLGNISTALGLRLNYADFWNSSRAKPEEKFDANPWCWKVTREKVEGNDG